MILTISDVIDADSLAALREDMAQLRWQDGARTAGGAAAAVKTNLQADLSSRAGLRVRDRVQSALSQNAVLKAAAQPARFSDLIVSRTEEGGGYGQHVDNAFIGGIRTDLSFTLFLDDPESYEGGELQVDGPSGRERFKPAAGSVVLYPSGSLHAVRSVTTGVRHVCVGWIESRVKSAFRREILFDLENLSASLAQSAGTAAPDYLTLAKAIANLKRTFG